MDVKKATTFASVTIMTFMLSGGFFVQVRKLCERFSMHASKISPRDEYML